MTAKALVTVLSVLILGSLCGTAHPADSQDGKWFTHYRTQDAVLEAAWVGLHLVDMAQTHDIVNHPTRFHENNPILGSHPTHGRVNTFFLASAAIHGLAVWAMPREYRPWFQGFSIVVKGVIVGSNHHIGLQAAWPF